MGLGPPSGLDGPCNDIQVFRIIEPLSREVRDAFWIQAPLFHKENTGLMTGVPPFNSFLGHRTVKGEHAAAAGTLYLAHTLSNRASVV